MSKINLNYNIPTAHERNESVKDIVNDNLSENELETIANYILYGKDADGTSCVDRGEVNIETKNKTWARKAHDSLEEMLEKSSLTGVPLEGTFGLTTSASGVQTERVKYLKPRPKINRETLSNKLRDNEPLLQQFRDLWHDIDSIDYQINQYEVLHGKRTSIRKELLKLVDDRRAELDQAASCLNQYDYLKLRHRLVQLRQLQYHLKDSFESAVNGKGSPTFLTDSVLALTCLPNGHYTKSFPTFRNPVLTQQLLNHLRSHERLVNESANPLLDFRNPEHVNAIIYHLSLFHDEITSSNDIDRKDRLMSLFLTVDFYLNNSALNDVQREVVRGKLVGKTNKEIQTTLADKFDHYYKTVDYISTIFTKICCPEISKAAIAHEEIIKVLTTEGSKGLKKCRKCGQWMVRSSTNFVKKARSADGFASSCKECDKLSRKSKG